ncbi:MAG TPA: hypothetical protein VFS43_08750 [Polyangiaceae bacterium]|nr:hypothetical protein [Polyangiaceae bacterium]
MGRALRGRRDQAIVATKSGFKIEGGKMVGLDAALAPEKVAGPRYGRQMMTHIDC